MNEELKIQVREIIRQELAGMVSNDRFMFKKNIEIAEGMNIKTGTSVGSFFGSTATDKIGFYGVTPIVQQATLSDPSGGVTIDSQARSTIGNILTSLKNIGIIKSS